jgi:hypothetical protein
MTAGGLLQKTVVACLVISIATAVVGSLTDHMAIGFGLAAGILLGSFNGYLIQGLIGRKTPFVASSLLRIVLFSSIVLLAALMLRSIAWTLPLGIGVAQLVMVGVGIRQGMRA